MSTPSSAKKKRVNRPDVPLSETAIPKLKTATQDEVLQDLRRLAEAEPERVISRNYYRINGKFAESAWNQYFGTFDEFKRQAGIILSRQQHQLEKHIAKHASVDHYRALNEERNSWGERYLRTNKRRFKTLLLASDLHDKEIDPFYLRVLIDTAKRADPDVVSLVGDVFDLPEFGKYTVDPREWDAAGRIRFALTHIFTPLRKAAPEAQFDLVEGNHEARLLRMVADSTPALRAVLADLHGMTLAKLFKLDELEVNYVAQADLAAYTTRDFTSELRKNYRIYFDTLVAHHFPDARSMGMPGVNGHHHKHVVWPGFNPTYGPYEWHQMGCGHKRDAVYCNGEKWHTGFALAHVDVVTKASIIEYVPITDFAVVGGKFYVRNPSEIVV